MRYINYYHESNQIEVQSYVYNRSMYIRYFFNHSFITTDIKAGLYHFVQYKCSVVSGTVLWWLELEQPLIVKMCYQKPEHDITIRQ